VVGLIWTYEILFVFISAWHFDPDTFYHPTPVGRTILRLPIPFSSPLREVLVLDWQIFHCPEAHWRVHLVLGDDGCLVGVVHTTFSPE
jgi:hypothetical protein